MLFPDLTSRRGKSTTTSTAYDKGIIMDEMKQADSDIPFGVSTHLLFDSDRQHAHDMQNTIVYIYINNTCDTFSRINACYSPYLPLRLA
jgi:hypothetical protein